MAPFTEAEQLIYEEWVMEEVIKESSKTGQAVTEIFLGLWLKDNVHLICEKYTEIKGL